MQARWSRKLRVAAAICLPALSYLSPTAARADSMADPTGAIYGGASDIVLVVSAIAVIAVVGMAVFFLRRIERSVRRGWTAHDADGSRGSDAA